MELYVSKKNYDRNLNPETGRVFSFIALIDEGYKLNWSEDRKRMTIAWGEHPIAEGSMDDVKVLPIDNNYMNRLKYMWNKAS